MEEEQTELKHNLRKTILILGIVLLVAGYFLSTVVIVQDLGQKQKILEQKVDILSARKEELLVMKQNLTMLSAELKNTLNQINVQKQIDTINAMKLSEQQRQELLIQQLAQAQQQAAKTIVTTPPAPKPVVRVTRAS